MKEIINIDVTMRKANFVNCKTDILAVGMFSGDKKIDGLAALLDRKLNGAIQKIVNLGDFKAEDQSCTVIYGDGKIAAKRILLVGLGDKKKANLDTLRTAAAVAAGKAVSLKAKTMCAVLHDGFDKLDNVTMGQALAEGACFGGYKYDEYVGKTKNGNAKSVKIEIVESDAKKLTQLKKGLEVGNIIGQAQAQARTIANRPANVISPAALAAIAKKIAAQTKGLTCTVFDDKQLKQKKMGGILAVGAGSANTPRLIVLKYTPKVRSKANIPTIGLVGKAITFDSGGISIKPSAGMQDMKFDKSGGVAVIFTMKAIAQLQPAVNVYGIIPSAENMPSASSYRPGDIVTTFSGKTVEVQNTDAEGRMILCDAIHYAVKQNCDTIVDIATLTGACVVALGQYKAGLMGSDDALIEQLKKASDLSGEKVWHMPIGDEYLEEMKSKIADLKNTGSRWGGACTAAAFLKEFTGNTKWAHIDMAGVDMFDSPKKFGSVGSTGFGVRLLTTYIMNLDKKKK